MSFGLRPFSEADFVAALPEHLRAADEVHFTPAWVIELVAEWLSGLELSSVLDIGSGVGKFCVLSAMKLPDVQFVGVERRLELHSVAQGFQRDWPELKLEFILADVLDLDLSAYKVLYLYNPFFEHVADEAALNREFELYESAFEQYQNALRKRLQALPLGTIVIAYHGEQNELPYTYELQKQSPDGLLKMWIKKWIV